MQLTSKLATMITSLPVKSPDDVLQRNQMTASLVSNPETVSTETAVSSHHIYTSYNDLVFNHFKYKIHAVSEKNFLHTQSSNTLWR